MKRAVVFFVGFVLLAGAANGAVRYVSSVSGVDAGDGTNPGAPLATIQYAVDQSGAGDEIRIATYEVEVVAYPPFVLTNTCVYGGGGGNVIEIGAGKPLALKGGYLYARDTGVWQEGFVPARVDGENARRGLRVTAGDGETNRIELVEFADGAADDGANVFAEGGSLLMVGTPIVGGNASGAGGGLYLRNVDFSVSLGSYSNLALPQMTGLLPIYSNTAAHGGGLYLDGGNPVLTTVGVLWNTATGDGGGVFIRGGMPFVVGGAIRGNTAGGNGGGLYLSNSVARVGGMLIVGNRAKLGGGLHFDGPFALSEESATIVANNYIQDNEAEAGRGGGLYFNAANVGIVNNIVAGNRSSNGAAAFLYASSPRFYQNTIADNEGETGIHVTHSQGEGYWVVIPTPWGPISNWVEGVPIPSWPCLTNTIVSGHETALYVDTSGNSLLENKVNMGFTLWWSNVADRAGAGTIVHQDDLEGDPLFTSKGTPPEDPLPYHIRTNSPAIDSGTDVSITLPGTDLLLDIDGQFRPSGAGMDIGADEVVVEPFSVWFVPSAIARAAQPGDVLTNQHWLINSGTQSDSYDVSVTNSLWDGSVEPLSVSLDAQSHTTVWVRVVVPPEAANGETNLSLVKAISQGDPNRMAVALDTTSVNTNLNEPVVRYVWTDSPSPAPPYTTPETAGHDIQSVVDVCNPGDTVRVYPGVYDRGGRPAPGSDLTNRVTVGTPIVVESTDGPARTFILGASDDGQAGSNAVRCVHLTNGVTLAGFTLGGGATLAVGGVDGEGGCAYAVGAVLSNCFVEGGVAHMGGGGVVGGVIHNSILRRNYGLFGGGAMDATLYNCILHGNGAQGGAAANQCDMVNCLVFQNGSTMSAGGAQGGTLINCTIVYNQTGGGGGGGVNMANTINCIVYYNEPDNCVDAVNDYTCTTPMPAGGIGNITNEPRFVDAAATNFHLLYASPCIDAGQSMAGQVDGDLDGTPRPLDGNWDGLAAWDLGCYEYDPDTADSNADGVPDWWYHRYGLDAASPTIGHEHGDEDGIPNRDEYIADTNPTNSASYFHIADASLDSSFTAFFTSSTGRVYTLQGAATFVGDGWNVVPGAGPRLGAGGIDSLADTNTPPLGPHYRLQVQRP